MSDTPVDLVDGWAIVGNHVHHGPLREGARCYVSHWSYLDTIEVLVAPKGRKWANYWTRIDRLNNLRVMRACAPKGSKLAGVLCVGEAGKAQQEATLLSLSKSREEKIARSAT